MRSLVHPDGPPNFLALPSDLGGAHRSNGSPVRPSSEGSSFSGLFTRVGMGHIVIGCDVEPAVVAEGLKDRREVNFAAHKGCRGDPRRGPVSTHGRRPAINALVAAGDGPSIAAQSCFSRHLGPGPRI